MQIGLARATPFFTNGMDTKTEYITPEKHQQLQEELNDLKVNQRKEVAEKLEYAKSLGDLSENAEYHEPVISRPTLRIGFE